MTKFEQQVKDALLVAIENRDSFHRSILETGGLRPITPEVFVHWLAPRVAAAIELSWKPTFRMEPGLHTMAEMRKAAALAALRGDE